MAMKRAIEQAFDVIELDLVLTEDGVPVLSDLPWLRPGCQSSDGAPLNPDIAIRFDDLTLEELVGLFRCGGTPDPEFPNALIEAQPVLTFDEFLGMLPGTDPTIRLHLDIGYQVGWTPAPARFAQEILQRWVDADLPHAIYVSSDSPVALDAFQREARAVGESLDTCLVWPPMDAGQAPESAALRHELGLAAGVVDLVKRTENAGADGLCVYHRLAGRRLFQELHRAGLEGRVWTVNEPGDLGAYRRWAVDGIITDYPGDWL
jgi:glycerophosphoryl diester phosphodiesterase